MANGAFGSIKERIAFAIFFGVFLIVGCAVLISMMQSLVIPEWRVNHRFVEAQCTILDKRIVEHKGDDGPMYRPEFCIRYAVASKVREVWTYEAAKISISER